jgi:hypothetical protein
LHVHFLVEDAIVGKLTRENVRDMPRGFSAYLDALWQEIRAVASDASIRDLFGTLAVAIGPIGRSDSRQSTRASLTIGRPTSSTG